MKALRHILAEPGARQIFDVDYLLRVHELAGAAKVADAVARSAT